MKWPTRVLVVTGLCVIAAMFAITTITRGVTNSADAANAGNGAFRDGAYQGKLAVQRGDRPHLSAARWSRDQDRRAYVAGYQQAYLQALGQNGIIVPRGIEEAGYRDGLGDGAQDRQSDQQNVRQGDHLLRAIGKLLDHGDIRVNEAYREAYSTGYQLAYYSEQELHNALVIRPISLGSY
jgi:hypothetical protein